MNEKQREGLESLLAMAGTPEEKAEGVAQSGVPIGEYLECLVDITVEDAGAEMTGKRAAEYLEEKAREALEEEIKQGGWEIGDAIDDLLEMAARARKYKKCKVYACAMAASGLNIEEI